MTAVQELINYAKSWSGYLEKKSNSQLEDFKKNAGNKNYTIFAKWYKECWGDDYQAQPWCAVFVSICFKKVFRRDDIFPHFSYCPDGVNQFAKQGEMYKLPEPGDVIFFTNGKRAYHTGIVTDVKDGFVYTIEGNTSDSKEVVENGGGVCEKKYLVTNPKIYGYGRPQYEIIDKEREEMTQDERKKFNALVEEVSSLKQEIIELKNPMIYNYVDKNMPEWAREAVNFFISNGILQGTGSGLNLSDTKLWFLVVLHRAIKFLKK